MRPKDQALTEAEVASRRLSTDSNGHSANSDEEDEDGNAKRGVEFRQYIKEKLMGHPIWQDGNYWEQALWQCAIEQVRKIIY